MSYLKHEGTRAELSRHSYSRPSEDSAAGVFSNIQHKNSILPQLLYTRSDPDILQKNVNIRSEKLNGNKWKINKLKVVFL